MPQDPHQTPKLLYISPETRILSDSSVVSDVLLYTPGHKEPWTFHCVTEQDATAFIAKITSAILDHTVDDIMTDRGAASRTREAV